MVGTKKSAPASSIGTWPMHFAKKDIGGKLAIKKGDLFPIQDKQTIKGLGAAAGCPNSWKMRFHELPYVETIDVRTRDIEQQIKDQGLSLTEARRLLEG